MAGAPDRDHRHFGSLGDRVVRRLERDPEIEFVAGIDTSPPAGELGRTEFIEADIRSPVLALLLSSTEPDAVVHCGFLWYPERGKPDRALHDINVIGTLQLLAGCERTPTTCFSGPRSPNSGGG
jgi:UDP-glucose 4-epimerase